MKKDIIASGAEAIIEKDGDFVIKTRIKKSYRIEEVDQKLRKTRTRAEARILEKLNAVGFPVPSLKESDAKEMKIEMEFIDGEKLRDVLDEKTYKNYCKQLAKLLKKLHDMDIIHSDLTTSNMLVKKKKVYFIDFGLSYVSKRTEDKAVDLHLLYRALDSYHHTIVDKAFNLICKEYNDEKVLNRLKEIEKRGRYKRKNS
jgi:TP53 regulating kinase and related kinases